jgi:hypothetical protein
MYSEGALVSYGAAIRTKSGSTEETPHGSAGPTTTRLYFLVTCLPLYNAWPT